jgi:hypothetical protein
MDKGFLLIGAIVLLIVVWGSLAGIGLNIFKGLMVLIWRGAGVIALVLLVYFTLRKLRPKR